ncbi:MAG TPA: DNA-directed RNA polymerase subunit beta [Bacilli bacterium]|nr:DNA-directed RNA polymerase subunit beta [Bacilli bacterium]
MTLERSGNEAVEQREEHKNKRTRTKKRDRIRMFPIWLRLVIIVLCCVLSLVGGVMFGFGVIGDGKPLDALKFETWQHILDLMNGVE